jgi:hypothetical protein
LPFLRKLFGTVCPGRAFLPNWHLDAMCHELAKVLTGETNRLIISIPPRHMESICTSVALPAWILSRDPSRRIICVSALKSMGAVRQKL